MYDYVINAGDDKGSMEPMTTAKNEAMAVFLANQYLQDYKFVDVVYSPEADPETNELIYKNY